MNTNTVDDDLMLGGRALLRVPDAARILDVTPQHLYKQIKAGNVPSVRIGRSLRVPASYIRGLLA